MDACCIDFGHPSHQQYPSMKGKQGSCAALEGEGYLGVNHSNLQALCRIKTESIPSQRNMEDLPDRWMQERSKKKETKVCASQKVDVSKKALTTPGKIIESIATLEVKNSFRARIDILPCIIGGSTHESSSISYLRLELTEDPLSCNQIEHKSYTVVLHSTVKETSNYKTVSQTESFEINGNDGKHAFLVVLSSQNELLKFSSDNLTVEYQLTLITE